MSREVFKPITSGQSDTMRKRAINNTEIFDKENIVQNFNRPSSKGAIPKAATAKGILKNSNGSNVCDTNIASSSSSVSKDEKEMKTRLKFKPENTYPVTQFRVFYENTEIVPTAAIKIQQPENDNDTLFRRSREFFRHQEQTQHNCEINSPVAKRVLTKITSGESFREAKRTFTFQEEAEKIRKQIDSMLDSKHSHNQNIVKIRRIAELKSEYNGLDKDCTPYDNNNIPPPRKAIKVLHKHSSIDNFIRPGTALPSWSLNKINSLSYNEDIMNFYLLKEKSRREFNPNLRRQNATLAQRELLIGHLIKIINDYHYSSFIAYQTARLLDDMLNATPIPIEQLQLVELTSMWIVMKNLLLSYVLPHASKIVSFSDGAYTIADLYRCEQNIMRILKFNISYPDPYSVLGYSMFAHEGCIFIPTDSSHIYYSGTYMLDVALFDEYLMKLSAILLGSAAAELALIIYLAPGDIFIESQYNRWRTKFTKANFTAAEVEHVQALILRRIAHSGYRDTPEHIVYKKYKRSRYGRISQMLILRVTGLIPSEKP